MNAEIFFATFLLIFLASLPGRTTFVMMLLVLKEPAIAVLIGSLLAFFLQCLIAVLFGSLLGLLPQFIVHFSAGLLFLFFAYKMWTEHVPASLDLSSFKPTKDNFLIGIRKSFIAVFVAEW